jgi:hypothetical protein
MTTKPRCEERVFSARTDYPCRNPATVRVTRHEGSLTLASRHVCGVHKKAYVGHPDWTFVVLP